MLAVVGLLAPAPAIAATPPSSTIDRDGRAGRTLGPTAQHAAVEARPLVSARAAKSRNARTRVAVPAVLSVALLVLASLLFGRVPALASSLGAARSEGIAHPRAPPAHLQSA